VKPTRTGKFKPGRKHKTSEENDGIDEQR
jgi:hypothetical protein